MAPPSKSMSSSCAKSAGYTKFYTRIPLSNISHTTATRRSRPGYCSGSQSYSTTNPAADDERLQYINAQILDAGRRITQCEEIHRTNRSLENTEALLRAQRDKIMWTNKRNNADSMRSTPVTPLTTPSALDPLRWSRSCAPSSSIGILDPCQSRYSQSSTVPGVATQLYSLIWQVQIGLRPPCKACKTGIWRSHHNLCVENSRFEDLARDL